MASKSMQRRAQLSDLPPDFSWNYLQDATISLKSKQQGFKYFSEGYIHDVSMYFDNQTENLLNVSARCYRSQRKNENPHRLNIDISLTKITDSYCSCQAGMSGSCSHVVGLIQALQQWQLMGFSSVPDQLACTSLPQQWNIPRGPRIEPVAVTQLQIVNPKPDRKKRPVKNLLEDCRKIRVQPQDIAFLQSLSDCPISYLACSTTETVTTHLGPVPVGSGLSTHASFFEMEPLNTVGTVCGNLTFPKTAVAILKEEYVNSFDHITIEQCVQIEENTRDQSENDLWVKERKSRLTASNFGKIMKRKKVTEKFVSSLINPAAFTSAATSYGKCNEKKAIGKYIKTTGNHVHNCGLIVNPAFPFLGASPDGKVCDAGLTGLLEVKCPYSARDLTVDEACNLPNFCLQKINNQKTLREDHCYYYQVQGQLLVSGADFCDFVVMTKTDLFKERIHINLEFVQKMLDRLSEFYFKNLKPVMHV